MQTEIVAGECAAPRAIELLGAGELVALPTETVYGLAADALSAVAVAKIFEAKQRPKFDPLIVHLPQADWVDRIAFGASELERALMRNFWPGPLTLVLTKRAIVPDVVTAGLATVAVRISAHPVFEKIIRESGRPLAAPSANRFGRISPTTASDVSEELDGRIPLIVDAGATAHGLESTIVRVRGERIEVLRRGPVGAEELARFGHVQEQAAGAAITAPGQLASHYAPRTKLVVAEGAAMVDAARLSEERVGLLCLKLPSAGTPGFAAACELSARGDLKEAAAQLFQCLRHLDNCELDLIVAQLVPERGIGAAINDRLRRAAG